MRDTAYLHFQPKTLPRSPEPGAASWKIPRPAMWTPKGHDHAVRLDNMHDAGPCRAAASALFTGVEEETPGSARQLEHHPTGVSRYALHRPGGVD